MSTPSVSNLPQGEAPLPSSSSTLPPSPGVASALTSLISLNFGGPGWISDVFEVSVALDGAPMVSDDGAKFTVPWTSWKGQAQMYQRDR